MLRLNRTFYVLLLAATMVCGCSQHEESEVTDSGSETRTTGIVFRLQANGTSATTRSVEDSGNYLQGDDKEYWVYNARVYLYDSPTKLFVKSIQLKINYENNGTQPFDGRHTIFETERVSIPQGAYDIFVIANSDKVISRATEDQFLAAIDSTTYVQGQISDISKGIVMTNRGSDNIGHLISSTATNDETVIPIKLERVLARLDIGKGKDEYPLTEPGGVKTYATVMLDRHYIVNMPKYYYLFRHTAVLENENAMNVPNWNINQNFGDVSESHGYVIDPYFFKKTINAEGFTNQDKYYEHFLGNYTSPNSVAWTTFKSAGNYNTAYCLENCMLQQAQKNGYSTGIFFDARIEPNNNVYQLNKANELELITDKTKYPDPIYYYNYNFYDSPNAVKKAAGISSTSATDEDIYTKKFKKSDDGYHCYYVYWIRHQDNHDNYMMDVMEFAIVRNNYYKITVTDIAGLGDTDIPIVPDKPDEGETYLKVELKVRSWIVRDLPITF